MTDITHNTLVDQARLAGHVAQARGCAWATLVDPLDSVLLELHDALKASTESGSRFVAGIQKMLVEQADPPKTLLQVLLVGVTEILDTLRPLLQHRGEMERALGPRLSTFWSEQLQDDLEDLAEELDDIQETLALGLSEDFQTALAAARAELELPGRSDAGSS